MPVRRSRQSGRIRAGSRVGAALCRLRAGRGERHDELGGACGASRGGDRNARQRRGRQARCDQPQQRTHALAARGLEGRPKGDRSPTLSNQIARPSISPSSATCRAVACSAPRLSPRHQQLRAQRDLARDRIVRVVAAPRVTCAERRRPDERRTRTRSVVPRQRPLGRSAAHRCACQRQLLALARQGRARPDNRLDQQPDCTANLGLDYRFRTCP